VLHRFALLPRFGAVFITLVAVDLLWLGWLAAPLYQGQLGPLMAKESRLWAALLFYAVYTWGILHFVVPAGSRRRTLGAVLGRGAAFGLVAYATFELTALAVLKDWPLLLPWLDMAWGVALTALAAAAGRWADRG